MARPTAAAQAADHPQALAGWSAVAAVLNDAFTWPDGRVLDRRQVERWHVRRTLNKMGQAPPSPVRTRRKVPRTAPRVLFEAGAWVQWARAGVPGPRNLGWTIPVER